MRSFPCLLALLCSLALTAQDYHGAFHHQGGSGIRGVGYDSAGNFYGATGVRSNAILGPTLEPVAMPHAGFVITKHGPSGNLVWWRELVKDPDASVAGDLELLCYDMAVAANGDLFVAGTFAGTVDFDPGSGQALRTTAPMISGNPLNTYNAYLLKLNAAGEFQWVRTWRGNTEALSVAISPNGNVHIGGISADATINLNPGASEVLVNNLPGNIGLVMGWLVTLNSAGNYLWGHAYACDARVTKQGIAFGAGTYEKVSFQGIAVDPAGNVTVAGTFGGSFVGPDPEDYGPNILAILTEGSPEPMFQGVGNGNMLVISYDAAGNRRWLNHYSTPPETALAGNIFWDVAADEEGAIYCTGNFQGIVDFNPPAGAFLESQYDASTELYNSSIILLKLDTDGTYQWAHGFKTSSGRHNIGRRVAADETGVVLAGVFGNASLDLGTGVEPQVHHPGHGRGFVLKVDKAGDYLWSLNYGAGGSSNYPTGVESLAIGPGYRIAIGGYYNGSFQEPGTPGQSGKPIAFSSDSPTGWFMALNQPELQDELTIEDVTLPVVVEGSVISVVFSASGGSELGYTWSVSDGALPPGVDLVPGLAPRTVRGAGFAAEAGEWPFTLRVQDDMGREAFREFLWIVEEAPVPPPISFNGGGGAGGCVLAPGSGQAGGYGLGAGLLILTLLAAGGVARGREKCRV